MVFNPKTSDTGILNQTGASRGFKADTSLGDTLKGVAGLIDSGINLADKSIKHDIETDAKYGFESLNDEFNLSSDTMPPELMRNKDGISKLHRAYQQGNISETYYHGRLASQLKGLRSKYPGYEKEVDSIVQKVTGIRPANAYRDALFAEVASEQREAQKNAGSWEKYLDKNAGEITRVYGAGFWQDTSKFSKEEIRSAVGNIKATEADMDNKTKELALLSSQNKLTEEKLKETATGVFSQEVGVVLGSLQNGSDMDSKSVLETIRDVSGGGNYNPEEIAQLSNQMAIQVDSTRQRLMGLARDGDYYKYGKSAKDVNQMIEESMAPLLSIQALIDNKEYGIASLQLRKTTLKKNHALATLMENPKVQAASALQDVSPALAEYMINSGDFGDVLGQELTAQLAVGNVEFEQGVDEILKSSATEQEKGQSLNDLITGATTVINSGKASPSELNQTVNSVYGKFESESNIFTQVQTGEYKQLFGKMYSPSVTAEIAKTAGQKEKNIYVQSAFDRFQAIPEFRKAAGTITAEQDFSKVYDVQMNGGVLSVQKKPSLISPTVGGLGGVFQATEYFAGKNLDDSVRVLNSALEQMAPIIAMTGEDYEKGVASLMKNLSLDLDKDQSGFFNYIYDSILMGGKDGPKSETEKLDDQTSIDFKVPDNVLDGIQSEIASAVDIGETAGTGDYDTLLGFSQKDGKQFSSTKVTEKSIDELIRFSSPGGEYGRYSKQTVGRVATPMGRYQIVGKTLKSLKTKLGLSGDEKFTPELQDKLFSELLRGRGYDKYIAGEISKEKFISDLSKEWEGFKKNKDSIAKLSEVL